MSGVEPRGIQVQRIGAVAVVVFDRPPHNHLDFNLLRAIVSALTGLDAEAEVRSVVLASEGKHFCAGADFARDSLKQAQSGDGSPGASFYKSAVDLFRTKKPIVAAVQGAAVGAGLGLALAADFRVTCAEAWFSGNFVRLGIHPGFGLSETLPRLIGKQNAALMLMTGRRFSGEDALGLGLADVVAPAAEVRCAAIALAQEIAEGAPLAVQSTRATLRRGLADAVEAATERESVEQAWLAETDDFQIGVRASQTRTQAQFTGR